MKPGLVPVAWSQRQRPRIAARLAEQSEAGKGEHDGEHDEHRAPAEMVADDAAGDLAGDHAGHLPGEEPRQHRLAPLVRHDVADIGHAERHDGRRRRRADEPRQRELRQRLRQRAQQHQHRRRQAGDRHPLALAEAVAEHTGESLRQAVGDGIGGDDRRGRADAGAEIQRRFAAAAGRKCATRTRWRRRRGPSERWRGASPRRSRL